MKLTVWNRIKICLEVLTIQRGHKHYVQEKELSLFQRGYDAGLHDKKLEADYCIPQAAFYKPACFGKVYESFHDCEPCPVYDSCEMKALVGEL